MTRLALVLAAALAPLAALAQATEPEPAPPPQQPQAQPPPQQPSQQQPQAQPPPQQTAQQQPQPHAQPPPQQPTQQQPQAQPPPAPTTSATPPPANPRRSPLAIVFTDAAFGGAAGLLVGTGVALVNQGGNWGKDLSVGAGIGIIIGAAVGVAHAAIDARNAQRAQVAALAPPRRGLALDGLGSTARDPVIQKAPYVAWGGRF